MFHCGTVLRSTMTKTGAKLDFFLSQVKERQWVKIISRYRRKGGVDSFQITNNTNLCEFHFSISCIKFGYGTGKKLFVPGSISSISKKSNYTRIQEFDSEICDESDCKICTSYEEELQRVRLEGSPPPPNAFCSHS